MSNILVIGSSNTDMVLRVPSLPGLGETVLGHGFAQAGGGKGANQALAAARAGGHVSFLGRVGADAFGERALAGLAAAGIDTACCHVDAGAPSGIAQILVDDRGENCIAVAPGANARLDAADLDAASSHFAAAAVLLLQLETPLPTVQAALARGRDSDCITVLNPAPAGELPAAYYPLVDILSPNEHEAATLTDIAVVDQASAAEAADVLHERGVPTVLITRGAAGVFLSRARAGREPERAMVPAFTVGVRDSTAAGDVFNGCLAAAIADGRPLLEALRFGQAGAALAVQVDGAQSSIPDRGAIDAFLREQPAP